MTGNSPRGTPVEIAKNIRAEGIMTDEQIAELVGLSVNEVKEL